MFSHIEKQRCSLLIVSSLLWVAWWQTLCRERPIDKWLAPYFGGGFNPPSVHFVIFGLLTLMLACTLFSLMEESGNWWIRKIVVVIAFLGRYTMYTFLYHLMTRDIIFALIPSVQQGGRLIRIAAFVMMIVFPPMIAVVVKKIWRYVVQGANEKYLSS